MAATSSLNCVAAMSTTDGADGFAVAAPDDDVPGVGGVVGVCANEAQASMEATNIMAGIRNISFTPENLSTRS